MAFTSPPWPPEGRVNLQVTMDQQRFQQGAASSFDDLDRCQVAAVIAAIDAGRMGDLRYFAAHGSLPPETPKWGKLRVVTHQTRQPDGSYEPTYDVYAHEGGLLARVSRSVECRVELDNWCVRLKLPHVPPLHYGRTPQEAVDAALKSLGENLGVQ